MHSVPELKSETVAEVLDNIIRFSQEAFKQCLRIPTELNATF